MHARHPPMSIWSPSQPTWAPSAESPLSPFTNSGPSLLPYTDAAGSFHTWGTSNIETSHNHIYPQQSRPLDDFGFPLKAPLLGNIASYSHRPQNLIELSYSHPPQFSPMPPQIEMAASPSSEVDSWPAENLSQVKRRTPWRSSNEASQHTEDRSRVNRHPRLRHQSIPNDRKLANGDVKADGQPSNRYEGVYAPPPGVQHRAQAPPTQELATRDLPQNPYHMNYNYPTVLQAQPYTQSYPVWPQMHGSPVPLPQAQPYQDHPPTMY